ncbi:uncharacterized protein LOC134225791 [Armigeres subalbatus]|uniref:uncharacterized protein LOC134225791 n=1 Tax=Armigeres subalbatus TaxID=124917 RepID=UPI002ED66622
MNRSKKSCVYRDCNINSQTHPELTLFRFPKSEARAAKWSELGAVESSNYVHQYMCELHFPRIYMCFSSRRKMLLSTAVPRAYGTSEEHDQQEAQSSFELDSDEITMEEHLDESMTDDNEDVATEIVYMDPESIEKDPIETDELVQPLPFKRRATSGEISTYTKITKVDQMPAISHSMIVSSSSTTYNAPSRLDEASKPINPPKGAILRKIKLKKQNTGAKTIIIKTVPSSSNSHDAAADATNVSSLEATVSSTPENTQPTGPKPDELQEGPSKELCSPVKIPDVVASSSKSTINEIDSVSNPVKKEEIPPTIEEKNVPIYEFIFKGEEYVQLPKAQYYREQEKLQKLLEKCESDKDQMQKKIDYFRRIISDCKQLLTKLDDNNSGELEQQ